MSFRFLSPVKGFISATSLLVAFVFLGSSNLNAQNGEEIFSNYCASCHKVDKSSIGPLIKDARTRWADQSSEENLYKWVKNSTEVINSGDAYANKLFKQFSGSVMTPQALSDEQITAVFDYVDGYVAPVAEAGGDVAVSGEPKESDAWIWVLVIAGIFIIIIMSVGSVRRQLQNAVDEQDGLEVNDDLSYMGAFAVWANKNKVLVGLSSLVILLTILINLGNTGHGLGVFEGYNPSQPIAFDHSVHAGQAEINCVYCHNSAEKSKHAGIPSVNVCMNCHKDIQEGTNTGKDEIAKIHSAAGFDAEKLQYTGEGSPIVWNKVHNLPDHVYFNHSQHVAVGKLDCAQCHGDVANITTGKIASTEELNAVEENSIKFTKPTLTMGWCLDCHNQIGIQAEGSEYYDEIHKRLKSNPELLKKFKEDDQLTVRELGGWECAKCHY